MSYNGLLVQEAGAFQLGAMWSSRALLLAVHNIWANLFEPEPRQEKIMFNNIQLRRQVKSPDCEMDFYCAIYKHKNIFLM